MSIRKLLFPLSLVITAGLAYSQAALPHPESEEPPRSAPPIAAADAQAQEAAAADDDQAPVELAGAIQGDRYVSANGVFSIKIPIYPELGGTITDTTTSVTFRDAFTTHITIAAIPLDSSLLFQLSTSPKKEFLVQFFRDLVMPDLARNFPGTNWERGRYLADAHGGAVLIQTTLPNGSVFRNRTALFGQTDPVTVARRGNLIFAHGDALYLVSMELGERSTERSLYTNTPEQDDELLRSRLVALLNSMIFTTPAASSLDGKQPQAPSTNAK